VILKDLRYPPVPDVEEPAVVRFQAVKELTDQPDEVVLDYNRISDNEATGERRALILVARRELLQTYQELCRAAGLKLAGLTPRPFGIASCLSSQLGGSVLTPRPDPADAAVAVLAMSERWAEFCILRNGQLLYARSVALGMGLAGEVRRNLAVYAGQAPQQQPAALYLAGGGEQMALRERLKDMLEIPIHSFDPLAGADRAELPPGVHGGFAGAVGLLQAWAGKHELPINFVKPREPKPPSDPHQRRLVLAAAVAAVLVLGVVGFCYLQLAALQKQVAEQVNINSNLEHTVTLLEDDDRRFKALSEWDKSAVNWLDEFYDLTSLFPDPTAVRVVKLDAQSLNNRTGKDRFAGAIELQGILGSDNEKVIDRFLDHFDEDGHHRSGAKKTEPNRTAVERRTFPRKFTTKTEVEKVAPGKYRLRLPDPPEREGSGDFEGMGGQP
jgi:hypothetical protein